MNGKLVFGKVIFILFSLFNMIQLILVA
jgi:hypothetical protein